jgi:ATP-dependent helicase/nuclease subunit A
MTLTERQLESLDTSSHLVVTAGAGSGKTKVLVERYMSVLRNDAALLPGNILALTFTEKASLEMKERIRKEVQELADTEGDRWEEVLDNLEEADISTIHSFCTSIIRDNPLSLGLDPDISVLTETETSAIMKDIIKKTFTTPGPESPALRRLIVDMGQFSVVNMVKGIIRDRSRLPFDPGSEELVRTSKLYHSRTAKELLDKAEEDMGDLLMHLKQLSSLEVPSETRDSGVRAIRGISEVLSLVRKGAETREMLAALSRSREVLLTRGGREKSSSRLGNSRIWGSDIKALKESFGHLFSYVHAYQDILFFIEKEGLMDRARERISDLLEVVAAVNRSYMEEKRKLNGMDFDDQISFAMELLKENREGILTKFRRRYRHVLIDEFQDTDPRQWKLAEMLWDGGKGCTLFLVGDPKQSIYGFRSADVRLFLKATGLLDGHEKGNVVVLDRNFRSSSEIMEFVNSVFPGVLDEGDNRWAVPFDPLEAHRSGGGSVSIVGVVGKIAAEAREGRMAAEIIKRALRGWEVDDGDERRSLRLSDIALLLPTRKGFERYEDALRNASIPYQVYKGRGFFERQEVKDVLRLLEFLTDTNDDIALASVLKGPFFSLSDEDLMTVSSGSGGNLWSKLGSCPGFSDVRDVILRCLEACKLETPWMALEEIYEVCAIHATSGGRRQYRNLDRLLEWMVENFAGRDLHEVKDALKMMIEEPPTEGEPPVSRDEDAVTVLTVHASKGLEWPMVLVLGMNHESRGDQWSNHRIHPDHGVVMKVLDTTTGELIKTPAWSAAGEENDIREKEERKRLFYVACTRARDHLVLSGVIPVDRNGVEQEPRGLMKLLKEGADLSLDDFEEPTKKIGGVDVRLFPVKQGEEPVPEEEEEVPIEIRMKDGSIPSSCDPVERGSPRFLNPTGEEVMAHKGAIERRWTGRDIGPDEPAPDEMGEIVHRALEGVSLKRLLREYGYTDKGTRSRIESIISDLKRQVEKIGGRHYREIEIVGRSREKNLPLKGRIDLLIEKEDGSLVVVDYKTGRKREEHRTQLEAYLDMLDGRKVEARIISPGGDYSYDA